MKGEMIRAGRGRKSVTVALAMEANPYVREEAIRRGWRLINLTYCEYILPPGIVPKGALIDLLPDDPRLAMLRKLDCKLVRLGRFTHPDDKRVPVILPDHESEARLAAEHFAERGFAHVGFLGNNPWRESKVMYDAFAASVKTLGMQLHLHRFRAFSDESRIPKLVRMEQEFTDWLRRTPQPLGLMAAGDWRAMRFSNWALRAGFSIPEELAVMGRGDHLSICEGAIPSISSFDLDEEKRIRTACDVLARMMAGEKGPTVPIYIAPKGVIERESTHVLATSDPVVAAALRFMWDHLDRDLSIEDVAGQVAVSSRQLERRFRQALGRSVNEELRRKRMEEGRRLLRTTDASIADIVPMIGFHSTAYFHNIFRLSFGTTPLKYRREARALAGTP